MRQEIVDSISKLRRQGTISYDQRIQIGEMYKEVFGVEKEGVKSCGDCLRDAFYKLCEQVDIWKNRPPEPEPVAPPEPIIDASEKNKKIYDESIAKGEAAEVAKLKDKRKKK